VCQHVCHGVLHSAELTDGYAFSFNVSEHVQDEISENCLNLACDIYSLVRQLGQYVVVVDAVLKLLHKGNHLTFEKLTRYEPPVRNHEHVEIAAVGCIRTKNEAIRIRVSRETSFVSLYSRVFSS
jgi:hypothetical protein